MRVTPINPAEAFIAPLFDSKLAALKDFTVEAHDGLPVEFSQQWDSTLIRSTSATFTFRWTGRLEFQHYDRLRLFINFPPDWTLSATAQLDGRSARLFENIPGETLPFEPTSGLLGRDCDYHVLTGLDFHFKGSSGRELMVVFYWIGLVSSRREPELERQLPRFPPDWPGLLNPRGQAGVVEPLFGSRAAMERLPALARQSRFEPFLRRMRQAVAEFEDYAPEPDIREYMPCDQHMFRYVRVRDRNRPRWDHPQRIQLLALAGFLDDHPAWSRLAARHVLALAHTPYWFEGPQCNCPGSDWHHVCFMESHAMGALCYALPFLGDWLTPAAREGVLDRIEAAWSLVNAKCVEPGYRWHMNQGVVNNSLRLLGAALLYHAGRGARYAEAVEQSYRDHTTVLHNYLAEDGHCSEGGYYFYSFDYSIPMWLVYAAFTGRAPAEVVPERFKRSMSFVEATTSTVFEQGAMMAIGPNAVGKLWPDLFLNFFLVACGWKGAARWMARRQSPADALLGSDALLGLLELMPETMPDPGEPARIQGCLSSGLVAYRFPAPRQGKLLLQAERPATGHRHHDRGGIVLEDAGEILLPDLGSLHYADLRCAFMHRADWHNLAHPTDLEMQLTDQPEADPPVPRARIERAEETAEGFEFSLDVTPIYGSAVRCGRRAGRLRLPERGGRLELRDVWEFATPQPVEILFNSYAPWTIQGDHQAWTQVGPVRLRVEIREAAGRSLETAVLDGRIDSRVKPVWTLRWRTLAEKAVDLQSTVSWSY